jgi:hypothetical protein
MSDVTNKGASASSVEVVAWFGVVAILILFVYPVLGVVVALVLDFTRLRNSSTVVRVGLVAFAVAVLAFQIVGLQGTQMTGTTGPAVPIDG